MLDFWLPFFGHVYALGLIATLMSLIAIFKYHGPTLGRKTNEGMFLTAVLACAFWPFFWYDVLKKG